jgi:hypothetical protein
MKAVRHSKTGKKEGLSTLADRGQLGQKSQSLSRGRLIVVSALCATRAAWPALRRITCNRPYTQVPFLLSSPMISVTSVFSLSSTKAASSRLSSSLSTSSESLVYLVSFDATSAGFWLSAVGLTLGAGGAPGRIRELICVGSNTLSHLGQATGD